MKKYLALNMKAYQTSVKDVEKNIALIGALNKKTKVTTIVCPSTPMLSLVAKKFPKRSTLFLGAQDAFYETEGAYTGMTSPKLLKDLKVSHVIVGHSERRAMGETNKQVNKKIHACLKNKLIPIVCVGEKSRDAAGLFLLELKQQIIETFAELTESQFKNILIAYEPVWAIGQDAKRSATPDEAVEMALYITKILHEQLGVKNHQKISVLYGGSVNSANAHDFVKHSHIAGLLVGRASVDPKELPGLFAACK